MCKHSSQFLFCLQRPSPDLLLNLFCQQHHNVIASCHELGHGIGRQGCMLELCQIVELLADHFCVLAVLVLSNILYQRMVGIQDQGLALAAESTHIHAGHGVHLHHILHTSALFGQRDHRRDLLVLQLLYLDRDLVILQSLLHQLADALSLLFHLFFSLLGSLGLQGIGHIRIDTLELDSLVLLLQLGDEGLINIVGQDHSIHLGSLEHIDVLALLLFIRYIVDDLLLLLFLGILPGSLIFRLVLYDFGFYLVAVLVYGILLVLFLILRLDLQALGQRQIFAVQILEEDVIIHLLAELVILQAAELDEGADVIPVLVVLFLVSLAHTGKLVRYLLGNVLGDLLDKSVVLQCTSGYIQRQIRAVDDTL